MLELSFNYNAMLKSVAQSVINFAHQSQRSNFLHNTSAEHPKKSSVTFSDKLYGN